MNPIYRGIVIAALSLTGAAAVAGNEYSIAEKRVFLDEHLKNVKDSATINYAFHQHAEKAEDSFDDVAKVTVSKSGKGKKSATVEYLSGARSVSLPDIGDATANPVILYFLEMDVRDMHRLVGGQEAYFRKRIRLALVDKATVKPVTVRYRGHSVAASEVRITPYVDDPLKERFGKFSNKSYTFTISDKVPGGVYEIRTQVDDPDASAAKAAPLMKTVLSLESISG
ncbi:MAG: hypothetical protein NVS9B10_24130 [Nevskia sp.]